MLTASSEVSRLNDDCNDAEEDSSDSVKSVEEANVDVATPLTTTELKETVDNDALYIQQLRQIITEMSECKVQSQTHFLNENNIKIKNLSLL